MIGRDHGGVTADKKMSAAVEADVRTLRAVPPRPTQRPLAGTKAVLARRMVSEGGYTGRSVDGVQRRLSGNGVPRRREERVALFEAIHRTLSAEFSAAGLDMPRDYRTFIDASHGETSPAVAPSAKPAKRARKNARKATKGSQGNSSKKRKPAKRSAASKTGNTGAPSTAPSVVFVGAHPDDVELGAGVCVQRCIAEGYDVHVIVLTDERGKAELRQKEGTEALRELGVPLDNIHFAHFRDGKLAATGPRVRDLRDLKDELGLDPRFVVTHTTADSHNDHVAANDLVRATFRKCVILSFSVHTSVEGSRFAPRLFVKVTDEAEEVKASALSFHESQDPRIEKGGVRADHERALGQLGGLVRAEAFEVEFQGLVAPDALREVVQLSDSSFHALWSWILEDGGDLYLLHEQYLPNGQPASIAEYSRDHEGRGRWELREKFQEGWAPLKSPLLERPCNLEEATGHLREHHVLLVGGAVSNPLTAQFFNRLSTVDFVIECDQPDSEPVYLLQRSTGRKWFPEFDAGTLIRDVAVLSVLPNPFAPGKWLVGCAGVHGRGTQGLLQFLTDPGSNTDLFSFALDRRTFNLPVYVDCRDQSVTIFPEFTEPLEAVR